MKNKTNLYIIMVLISFQNLLSYNNIDEFIILNRNYINLEYQRYSTGSFNDFSRQQWFTILDSIDILHEKEYSYEVQKNIVELSISQALYSTSNSTYYLSINTPLSFNNYEKIYKALYDTVPDLHFLHSDINVPFIGIKAGVDFKFDNLYLLGKLSYNLSLINKDTFQIFDTYYSNIIPEISFIYDAGKSYFNLDLMYKKYLSGVISDEFIGRFSVGLTTVESSVLKAFAEYSRSIDKFDTKIEFLPEYYQLQSENLKLGVEFQLLMDSGLMPKLGYEIILSGLNNPIYGKFHIGLSYMLKVL